MSPFEQEIYNDGERLIPGVSHTLAELIRHRSSYLFFRSVIELDQVAWQASTPVRIIDLGCGVGHGCATLAQIPNVEVVGVDVSSESITYARTHYTEPNIHYEVADLSEYIHQMSEFDYVVSRNVFEHIPDGIQLAHQCRWRKRLLFDVPYAERAGRNIHHLVCNIQEKDFAIFGKTELFYQDLAGVIFDVDHKPASPNVIACVCSHSGLIPVKKSRLRFPILPWRPQYTLTQRIVGKLKQIRRIWSN